MAAPGAPHWQLDGGIVLREQVILRRLRPGEEARLQTHVADLSPASRRSRFLGGMNALSPAEARRLVGDSTGPVFALAAEIDHAEGSLLVGEAICAIGADGRSAEFALSVADAWQGRGIGRAILAGVVLRSAGCGVAVLHGEVLRDNHRMLGLAARAGFACRTHADDPRLVRIERTVPAAVRLYRRVREQCGGAALAA
jgi:acetyltransferase